jgi:4-hydroxyphenylpyruvate dioxygenase-like putative hemolysin
VGNPRNVGRIDHIVIVVLPENIDRAAQEFGELLDVPMDGPYEPQDLGTRQYIDWESGIMLVAPVEMERNTEHTRFLAEHGEGMYRIVFGTADQHASLERANGLGYATAWTYDGLTVTDSWRAKFSTIKDGIIAPAIHGVRINFGQLEPVPATADSKPRGGWIHHVVILINPTSLDEAAREFSRLLDIEFEGPYQPVGSNVREYVSFNAGIVLSSPLHASQSTDQSEFLLRHGEGLFCLSFQPANHQAALARADKLGYRSVRAYDGLALSSEWSRRFRRIEAAAIAPPIYGVRLSFSQIEAV